MKTSHKFTKELENTLNNFDEDELYCWFEKNTIEYELEVENEVSSNSTDKSSK